MHAKPLHLLLATGLLFVLGAWPLLVCHVPPLEDLPAHLATAVVIRHPEAYPELVFHGFFKTNSALFLWLHLVGGDAHLVLASKLFVALVVLAHAWVLPRLVVEIGGPARLFAATILAVPLVHSWFVAMGMLDYALASALALGCLLLVVRQSRAASLRRGLGVALLGFLVWYTHVFALALLGFLAVIEVVRTRRVRALVPFAPLAPSFALAVWSAAIELLRHHGPSSHTIVYRPLWETLYELWAKYAWAFSKLELGSLVLFGVLAWSLWQRRRLDVVAFSPVSVVALLALYFALPSELLDWFAVNSRVLPFLYAAALVRAPEGLPRWAAGVLGAAALSCSVGLGADYVRLDRDLREMASGAELVPQGADLFPLIFEPKGSSENTWALVNGWGLYVLERHTSAPLLFAHSPSFPVGAAHGESSLATAAFAQERHTREEWRAFSLSLVGRGWILEWGQPPPSMDEPLPRHALAFERGRLRLFRPVP